MKKGAHLINASRGTVVDIDALVDALESGHLAGAGLDVFPVEPKTASDEFVSPLRGMDNVLLTSHVGGSTEEALPEHPGKHRLLYIHRNQPGVLSAINAVFSGKKINIAGQYLQTNAKIGYVVIYVETGERAASLQVKSKLEEIPGTIRTRILY
jgi:D-3-phosphoglycerate dehydrogenase